MTTIKDQFDIFHAKATQMGRHPLTKEGAMQLGFYAGFVAAMKMSNDISHDLSDLEVARAYESVRLEMAAFFEEANIKTFYGLIRPPNGKAKAKS